MMNLVQIIGVQRFSKLLILLLLNGVLGAALYYYVMPELVRSEREFKTVKNEVNRLRNDINTVEERLSELKENEKQYDRLLQREFISNQDRVSIRNVIDDMRARSGVKTLTYNIEPIQYIEHEHSYALDYDLIRSNVSVDVTALLDLEVLALQSMFNDEFPGKTVLEKVSYTRTNPITQENLVKIGNGQLIDFMRGKIDFSWYSLVEKPSYDNGGKE